jgi:hypothetical protein
VPKHVGDINDYTTVEVVCAFGRFSKRNYVAHISADVSLCVTEASACAAQLHLRVSSK